MPHVPLTPDLGAVVSFEGAGVRLPKLNRRKVGRSRNRLKRIRGDVARDEVWFVRDATFSLQPGEALAIVGHLNSGRDQLLRLAAGTLIADEGTVRRSVPIVPLVGLGGALGGGYTVRQNIYLLGSLLGMTQAEIVERLPGIVERADVGKILDKFLGDSSRLVRGRIAWSIAMATQAPAFAISQALTVGQPSFQQQCWEIVEERHAAGVSFLVVSDKPSELKRFCDRAILIDEGRVLADTTVEDALDRLKDIPPPKDQVHFVIDDDDDDDDAELI